LKINLTAPVVRKSKKKTAFQLLDGFNQVSGYLYALLFDFL